MDEYAISLFKFVCIIAAKDPKIIESIASIMTTCCQDERAVSKAENVNLTITVIAAILGTIAKKAVTGVGAPSYTSGVHIWKGTKEILKAKPESMKTKPINNKLVMPWELIKEIEEKVTNPKYLVEDADNEWIRGGLPTREMNREYCDSNK